MKDTQITAYNDIQKTVGSKRLEVLDVIKDSEEGRTLFEIESLLGWKINQVSGRVTELTKLNLIKDSGNRRKNPTSGKYGIVWVAQ